MLFSFAGNAVAPPAFRMYLVLQRTESMQHKGGTMVWIIIAVVILGISAYFGNEYRLDRKAHKLNSGTEEDRRLAAEMQDIARKIDEGKYLYR